MASWKDVDLSKICESCAAKMAIIMVSSSSPFAEEDIYGCSDPKCKNFCKSSKGGGSSQYSTVNELPESQLFILANLHINERKETEKLKQLLAIPPERMTEDQRSAASEEIDKFIQEIDQRIKEKSETAAMPNNNNKNSY